jgi:DNA-binding MarR family transcriptional regulator
VAGHSSPEPLTPDEEGFLRSLSRVLVVLPRLLDKDLVAQERIRANEYLVLMLLSEAPDRRLRMSDLAEFKDHSLSGMTRIVDRLSKAGWIEREKCAEDGRGAYAVLTETGFARLEQAWPTHLRSVRRRLMDYVDGLDLPAITAALDKIASTSSD